MKTKSIAGQVIDVLEGGADIFTISKMMGHSDIKTTTIYLSATTAHLRAEIDKHPLASI